MKPFRWILVLGLLAATFPLAAQAPADWYIDKPITDIRFDGLVTVQRSDIDGVTRPYLGRKFTESLFQDLQSALYNLDYFDGLIVPTAIKANDQGTAVILLFKVTEKPSVEAIDFTGAVKVHQGDLEGVLTIKKGDLVNQAKIHNDEIAVANYYKEHGFLDSSVTSSVESLENKKAKVVFKVKEGYQTAVKSLVFQGNSFASASTLQGVMDTKPLSWLDNGLFKEAAFTKDIRAVESYYWNHGYVDARVIDVQRNPDYDKKDDRNVLNIVITVREGAPSLFGGFEFTGNHVFTTEALQAQVRQVPGKTLNKEILEADYQRVNDLYSENGYIFNNISREEVRDGETIKYKVNIIERPRAHIENLLIKGNTKTKDKVILREMPIEVGDVFSKTKIVDGLRNLTNLQYFTSVTPETPQGSADGLMDLVLNVEEGKTADVSFGFSFSGTTSFPISAQVKWADKNFFGQGLTVGVESTMSLLTQSISLNYTDNWLMDRRMTFGTTLGFSHSSQTLTDQDIIGPNYSNINNAVADPYRLGEYVFQDTRTYNGITYNAGDLFPQINPSSDQISAYNLITRYQYDLNNGTLKKNGQMKYDSWQVSFGVNTGYSWYNTPVGRFSIGTGDTLSWQIDTYDDTVFRPANQAIVNNLDSLMFSQQWWTRATIDSRDVIFNPSSGYLASQTVTFAGGFLGGSTAFTRFDTRLEDYWKLWGIPVAEGYSFDMILKLQTNFSFLRAPLGGPSNMVVQPTDELILDGNSMGRGWGYQTGGQSVWGSTAELRTPIPFAAQYLWWDTWVQQAVLVDIANPNPNPFQVPVSLWQLSWGAGLRLVTPQFPLAVYLVKPFQLDKSDHVVWIKGDGIFGDKIDMKLVLALSAQY